MGAPAIALGRIQPFPTTGSDELTNESTWPVTVRRICHCRPHHFNDSQIVVNDVTVASVRATPHYDRMVRAWSGPHAVPQYHTAASSVAACNAGAMHARAPRAPDRVTIAAVLLTAIAAAAYATTSSSLSSSGDCFRSPDNVYCVCWEVDLDAGTIVFTMSANVTGWVSLGVGPMHTMADADMYTAWINDGDTGDGSAQVVLLDTFGTGHSRPLEDTVMGGTYDAANVTGTLVRPAFKGPRLAFCFRSVRH